MSKAERLLRAVQGGNVHNVKMLLDDNVADICGNVFLKGHWLPLLNDAAHNGQCAVLEELLRRHFPIDCRDYHQCTPLMSAIKAINESAHPAVKAGASASAIRENKARAAKLLIKAGANVNAVNTQSGWNVLLYTMSKNAALSVKIFLATAAQSGKHIDLNCELYIWDPLNPNCMRALHYAEMTGNHGGVEELLRAGAKVDHDAIVWAINRDSDICLRALVQSGQDVDLNCQLFIYKDQPRSYTRPIHYAAMKSKCVALKELLNQQVDKESTNSWYQTALMVAASCSQHEAVKLLVEKGAKANATRPLDSRNALVFAIESDSELCVRTLVRSGKIDLNCELHLSSNKSSYNRPLHFAIEKQKYRALIEMVDLGADTDSRDSDNLPPILFAVKYERILAIELLCEQYRGDKDDLLNGYKVDPNSELFIDSNKLQYTRPLIYAAMYKKSRALEELLIQGANVKYTDSYNYTALLYAVSHETVEDIRVLFSYKADLNSEIFIYPANSMHYTRPVHYTAEHGYSNSMRELLKLEAQKESLDYWNWTPLMIGARNGFVDIVKILAEHGGNVDLLHETENTAFMIAVKHNKMAAAAALLLYGAKADPDKLGDMLYYGIQNDDPDVVKTALNNGARVSSPAQGHELLMMAFKTNSCPCVEILIEHGATLSVVNNNGDYSLLMAVCTDNTHIIQAQIESGVDIDQINPSFASRTAFQFAVDNLKWTAACTLLNMGAKSDRKRCNALLCYGCANHKLDFVIAALAAGADKNAKNSNGASVQTLTKANCFDKAFTLLINHVDDKIIELNDRSLVARMPSKGIYPMTRKVRGRALIMINTMFAIDNDLPGGNVDAVNMSRLLRQLHYKTIVRLNLTAAEMRTILIAESQNIEHKNADSFILVLGSHGDKDHISGTDSKTIQVSFIMDLFDNENCPGLIDNPKLIIIDACQGNKVTQGLEIEIPKGGPSSRPQIRRVHPKADHMLVVSAAVSGYVSYCGPEGSRFIFNIVEVFLQDAHKDHLSDLMKKVKQKLNEDKRKELQAADELRNSQDKNWYFMPGYWKE